MKIFSANWTNLLSKYLGNWSNKMTGGYVRPSTKKRDPVYGKKCKIRRTVWDRNREKK